MEKLDKAYLDYNTLLYLNIDTEYLTDNEYVYCTYQLIGLGLLLSDHFLNEDEIDEIVFDYINHYCEIEKQIEDYNKNISTLIQNVDLIKCDAYIIQRLKNVVLILLENEEYESVQNIIKFINKTNIVTTQWETL